MSEDEKRLLEQQLWNIANTLRGKMNADEFRDYILGFIFYKYLSEKLHHHVNTELLSEDGIDYADIDDKSADGAEMVEAIAEEVIPVLGFMLKPSELFSAVVRRGQSQEDNGNHASTAGSHFILEDLASILQNIERSTMGTESEDDFNQLFEDLDLSSSKLGKTEAQKNELVVRVLSHLDKIDFKLGDTDADILGDSYEYLIGQFASGAGKKAGEFYTPQTVSTILAQLVTADKKILKSVYDPTCGSGSLLLRVAKEVKEVAHFYGQELNRTTYNLARMNMILHDVNYRKFDIAQEDSLEHPQHFDERFEAIVANPPFSAHWSANPLFLTDDRFSQYGKLAPKTKADFAFVLHMIHHLADNGNMAVVLPHGVLFRGAAEGHIRKHLIAERNILDTVIGLPANIFYGTSIPTCILVFKQCRTHPKDILFIDASQHFAKGKNQNTLRPEDIGKIVSTYKARTAEDKYSAVVPLAEVKENDYNLNIPRYVDTFEEEEAVDLAAVTAELKQLDTDMLNTDKTIADFCQQLHIASPF